MSCLCGTTKSKYHKEEKKSMCRGKWEQWCQSKSSVSETTVLRKCKHPINLYIAFFSNEIEYCLFCCMQSWDNWVIRTYHFPKRFLLPKLRNRLHLALSSENWKSSGPLWDFCIFHCWPFAVPNQTSIKNFVCRLRFNSFSTLT